jgi:hypothetical protein
MGGWDQNRSLREIGGGGWGGGSVKWIPLTQVRDHENSGCGTTELVSLLVI